MNTKPKPQPAKKYLIALICAVAAASLVGPLASCANDAFLAQVPPMLPTRYYNCQEAAPTDLYNAYLAPNAQRVLAAQLYHNEVFVFKNVEVVPAMLTGLPKDNIWLGQVICYAVNPGDISRLKAGRPYDIIGINKGIHDEWRYSIYLTECYFLPHGTVALPLDGSAPAFAQGY
jgi:hypothetical protein